MYYNGPGHTTKLADISIMEKKKTLQIFLQNQKSDDLETLRNDARGAT